MFTIYRKRRQRWDKGCVHTLCPRTLFWGHPHRMVLCLPSGCSGDILLLECTFVPFRVVEYQRQKSLKTGHDFCRNLPQTGHSLALVISYRYWYIEACAVLCLSIAHSVKAWPESLQTCFLLLLFFSYSSLTSATSSAVTYSGGVSRVLVIYHSTDCCW